MRKSGIYHDFIDHEIKPSDDLFRHVNGKWLSNTEIPADEAHWGALFELREKVDEQVRAIITAIVGKPSELLSHDEKLIKSLYKKFLNEDAIEKAGFKAISSLVSEIDSIESLDDFFTASAKVSKLEGESLFGEYVSYDDKNSKRMLAHFYQGGLSLPDRDYYLSDEYEEVRLEYLNYIKELSSIFNIGIDASKVLEFESKIAEFSWDQVKLRESELNYNLTTFGELCSKLSNIQFKKYLEIYGVELGESDEVNECQPSFFLALDELIKNESLEVLKNWLKWSLIDGVAEYLGAEAVKRSFEFWGGVINGMDTIKPRWRRAVDFVEESVGEAVGKFYIAEHYPVEVEAKLDKLIKNLLVAYRVSIEEAGWMGESTKKRALEKLSKFNPKIGGPKVWKDYSKLELDESMDLLEMVAKVNEWLVRDEFADLKREVDKSRWFMTPQTVNAYYNPNLNEIVFPAAFLQEPFFFKDADDAINYGSIGAVIGHEIAHGFDDQGAKYDGDGNMVSWWEEEDLENFKKLTEKLVDQYNELSPVEARGHKVNGSLTVGENIGDLIGLSVAYKAYMLSLLNKDERDDVEGYSGEARFFFGWAGSWREKSRSESMINSLITDPHAPSEFRCNQIVANLDGFYKAFNVDESSKSYIAPKDRVVIW